MKEKLAIANQMRKSRKSFSNNLEDKKLCSKCYHTYVIECIIKGKESFKISFKGKYIKSFSERMYDYYIYIVDSLYRFFLMNFTPDDDKTLRKYELIHIGVPKPLHLRIAEVPDETVIYGFLENNGFLVTNEYIDSGLTVYDVTRE